jgi:hypothetical protein
MKSYQLVMGTKSGRVAVRRLRGTRKAPGGSSAELRAAQEYLEAHALLPDRTTLDSGEVTALCALLDGGSGTRAEVVRALVILAHVGREPALATLRRYAERATEGLAIFADLAFEECEVWASEPRPPLVVTGTCPS